MIHSNLSISVVLSLCFSIFLMSCSSDDTELSPEQITEEEVAELVEYSLQASTGGLTHTINLYSEKLLEEIVVFYDCEEVYQDSVSYSHSGITIQADYLFEWTYDLDCNGLNIPTSVAFTSLANGSYTTNRITSFDDTNMDFNIEGLLFSEDNLTYNGNISRSGSQNFMTNFSSKDIESTLNMNLTALVVDKESYSVSSGSGLFNLNIFIDDTEYDFEGELVFNGDESLSLIINGTTYLIDLN